MRDVVIVAGLSYTDRNDRRTVQDTGTGRINHSGYAESDQTFRY